ncbi:MAG: KpsF/GutQ family sugar-phosphate isomerase [Marinosulfonomonas sp.]|nr:KpsF/GutQ family sugar-phosphate isomerase [Marinosulfonomonas sp.]
MTKTSTLSTAQRVINREADALAMLATTIGDSFAQAVDVLANAKGRVIVSGIGKSGHIARKIAATLASTGTPAQFVHPAEASHGDLGMVTSEDVALAISYSGEAPELANLIAFTRRFNIPLIGISGRGESTLIRQSDVALILPNAEEACGTGIVPSTSTTMTLAMGDALAICLMENRQFTPEDFRDFHPGGNLGARLSRVGDLMHTDLPLADESAPMGDVLIEISQKGFGVVGVTSNTSGLVGVVTDGDLRRHMDGLLDLNASQVMTAAPTTISPDALAQEAVALMNAQKITCLFVVDATAGPKAVGILHVHDCLRAGVV